ncbi:putative HTH-type transcriptional regulator YjiR [Hartmannibacter diazotrophicus]|uniref:Putative HTH-type transcriptional regulator YjiR n=1 Tax=Hartmannibacter diazotrophicus TaxID=1482074 RepID=A0A2C9D9Z5_9HYPH|nr:PLP-dependent aminotransferase family protein [Hartmannibacter diazotrophicus]SON57117.1 putative HTH-type transcriptional regulator YjiR [Hartmannibacter diazotrophicus]
MTDWVPDLKDTGKPRYLAIADAIAADVASGQLTQGDRLPPQRQLAKLLGIDFTTVARGYVEAQRRGLVDSRVGQGTFVSAARRKPRNQSDRRPELVDLSMNLPPEPEDPDLIERMQEGMEAIGRDLIPLLRYQGFGGSREAKEAASNWLGRRALVPSTERLFVSPGAHPALLGILCTLARPGDTILCEAITYPGIRSLAAQIGLNLVGLPFDEEGILTDALTEACQRHQPKALYLNPIFNNPTTMTVSEKRREEIAQAARRCRLPIVEDDAYGFIPVHGPKPFAAIAPDITWHVAGLAKCIGAGLRVAYVVTPDARSGFPFSAALRSATVMASPITVALATRWIEDGTADALLSFIRSETRARQKLAADMLAPGSYHFDPLSFHLWVPLPEPWTRSAFVGHMRSTRIGVVPSDPFTVEGPPGEAVRVCLGGPATREEVRGALDFMAHALEESPALMSSVL